MTPSVSPATQAQGHQSRSPSRNAGTARVTRRATAHSTVPSLTTVVVRTGIAGCCGPGIVVDVVVVVDVVDVVVVDVVVGVAVVDVDVVLVELLCGTVAGAAVDEPVVGSGAVVSLMLGVVDGASPLESPPPPQAATDETATASVESVTTPRRSSSTAPIMQSDAPPGASSARSHACRVPPPVTDMVLR